MTDPENTDDGAHPIEAGRSFVASCYEVFLGRELDSVELADERGQWPLRAILHSILTSDEFNEAVAIPLRWGLPFGEDIFADRPTLTQKLWAADRLPVGPDTLKAVMGAQHWRDLLTALVGDERLMRVADATRLDEVPQGDFARLELDDPNGPPADDNLQILSGRRRRA